MIGLSRKEVGVHMFKTPMRVAVILLLLGFFSTLLTVGLTTRMLWIRQEMEPVESHIVSITRERRSNADRHNVMIHYVYDGHSYTVRYNTYYATMKVGDLITIYVDPGTTKSLLSTESVHPCHHAGYFCGDAHSHRLALLYCGAKKQEGSQCVGRQR